LDKKTLVRETLKTPFNDLAKVQDSIAPIFCERIPEIPVDKPLMITSDWHVPAISLVWLKRMLRAAIRHNCKTLVIAGDLFNFDAISRFERDRPRPDTCTVEEELDFGEAVLKHVVPQFDNIYWINSNHDERFLRILRDQIKFDRLVNLLPGIDSTKFHMCEYSYIQAGDFRITHPDRARKWTLSKTRELANKFRCNIIMAHSHQFGIGYSQGGYLVMETGGLADFPRLHYMHRTDNERPVSMNGFCVLHNKTLIPYSEGVGLPPLIT